MSEANLGGQYYSSIRLDPGVLQIVEVPRFQYLTVEGTGGPASPEFGLEGEALVRVSFALKMQRIQTGRDLDYALPPMEAMWWSSDGKPMDPSRPDVWRWKVMIVQPVEVREEELAQAIVQGRKWQENPALDRVRMEWIEEGRAIQGLYVGHPAAKGQFVQSALDRARSEGWKAAGRFHEIYLSNPMRSPLKECRTIVRQPLARA